MSAAQIERVEAPTETPQKPLIYIVDDDDALRKSLCFLLESVNLDVATYASARDFLNACDPKRTGCLLADLRMPGMDGLELQEELQRRGWEIPTIFITGHGDITLAVRAMKNGAFDFFEKPLNDQLLLERIHTALEQEANRRDLDREEAEFARRFDTLSQRERQVLDLVIKGLTSVEMAPQLNVSPKTVEVHRASIMRKLAAQSVAHLVRIVLTKRVDTPLDNNTTSVDVN